MKGEVISRNLSTMCVIVASGIAILSGLSLVAWFYEWPWFLLFFQTSLPINPMSAILFMISGVAIVWKKYSASSRWPTFIFVLLLILSLYVALDKVFIFQWHIDALFFNEKITRYERLTQTGIGMSLVTAISFVIAFASLLIQSQSYRSIILREIIDLGVFFFSVMVLVVYIFHVPESHPFFFMAPLTAVLFAFLSFAALLSRPEDPIIKQLARGHFIYSPASILLPLSLIFPVVLGYVRLQGEWRHIISTELGVTFIILTFMLVLFTTTWFIARSFNQRMKLVNDYQLQANELTAANEELQSLTEELTANVEALAETNKALAQANTTIAKQKDEQLNRVLDFTKDVIWSFDLTGHGQNYLSHSAERIYQRPYHELIERPYFWIENVHPEDIEIVNSNRQRLETSGQVESTYRLMLNGKIHWFHDECRLVKDEQGIPQRLEGVASDVTEKVRQDLLLKEHQQQLEIIFNRTHDIFILLDENVRTLQFNKAAIDMSIEISGVPLQAGKNYLDSAPPFRKRELEQIIDRVFAGESVTLITDFPGRSGKMIHYKVVYAPVVTHGKITHI
ncbi:MAG TPA: hypothetical protein DGG95_12865, partial [Cytophagales bacterium]|nr:hypothetical protein [Cytophagales bacterium]